VEFGNIRDIAVGHPEEWKHKLFLTFDFDWACDEVLTAAIQMVENADVPATWFVTHETPLLGRLRENPKFELGIHPNFNYLLNNDVRNGRNSEEVVDTLLSIVPETKSIRSHSVTQNAQLLQMFVGKGITHDCNHFIPEQSGIELKPWSLWDRLVKVPYFWEDDVVCQDSERTPMKVLAQRNGLKVFDFHPIHVFLNTDNLQRYEQTREIHKNPIELAKYRCKGEGIRTALEEILAMG